MIRTVALLAGYTLSALMVTQKLLFPDEDLGIRSKLEKN